MQAYRDSPDPGEHSALDWLLRQWGYGRELEKIDRELQGVERDRVGGKRQWYVNGQGLTLAVVRGPVEYWMSSPGDEPKRSGNELRHRRRIDRTFSIATREVTVEQFRRFARERLGGPRAYYAEFSPDRGGPMIPVTWYEAAQYCNWLSEREGIPKEEWCYPTDPRDIRGSMVMPKGYLRKTGYRLPTEAEWEYACRAGAETGRPYGWSEGLLGQYAWYPVNSRDRARPVGLLRPNDLGLFDMLGNAWEWCQDRELTYLSGKTAVGDPEDYTPVIDTEGRILRGGGFDARPMMIRSSTRYQDWPPSRNHMIGMRVARTLPPDPAPGGKE